MDFFHVLHVANELKQVWSDLMSKGGCKHMPLPDTLIKTQVST